MSRQVGRLEGFWRGSWDRLAAAWVCCHSEHRAESELVSAGDGRKPESRQGAPERTEDKLYRKEVEWKGFKISEKRKRNEERQLPWMSTRETMLCVNKDAKGTRTWMGGTLSVFLWDIKPNGSEAKMCPGTCCTLRRHGSERLSHGQIVTSSF